MTLNGLSIVLILMAGTTSTAVQYFDKFQTLRNVLRQPFASVTMKQDKGRGVVTHCQGTPGPPFSVQWEPKVVSPDGSITVFYDYTIPHYFKTGTLYVELYVDNISNPIFTDGFSADCSKLGRFFPCPLKQGFPLKGQYTYSNLLFLKGYDGTYTGVLKLTNNMDEMMACANMTVTISSSDVH